MFLKEKNIPRDILLNHLLLKAYTSFQNCLRQSIFLLNNMSLFTGKINKLKYSIDDKNLTEYRYF